MRTCLDLKDSTGLVYKSRYMCAEIFCLTKSLHPVMQMQQHYKIQLFKVVLGQSSYKRKKQ
jgi:hypothetical protein